MINVSRLRFQKKRPAKGFNRLIKHLDLDNKEIDVFDTVSLVLEQAINVTAFGVFVHAVKVGHVVVRASFLPHHFRVQL